MSNKIVSMALAELVEDMDLYPRHAVDTSHVQALEYALESGQTLPPVVADRKSKRITDGWHRCRAYRRFLGDTATIDVELVPYESEAEMMLDAVARNAAHGRRLDAIDRTRSVIMLRNSGYDDAQISIALRVPENRVEKLAIKLATGPKSSDEAIPGTNRIALKRCVSHLSGTVLNRSQAMAHSIMPGTSFLLVARQLATALRENMVNLGDEKLKTQLVELRDLLVAKL